MPFPIMRVEVVSVSLMRPVTIHRLNDEEVEDLLAYLISGENPDNEIYSKKAVSSLSNSDFLS